MHPGRGTWQNHVHAFPLRAAVDIHRVIVRDEDRRLIGIVTSVDLLRAFST
jgi:CBS domain-containing protein